MHNTYWNQQQGNGNQLPTNNGANGGGLLRNYNPPPQMSQPQGWSSQLSPQPSPQASQRHSPMSPMPPTQFSPQLPPPQQPAQFPQGQSAWPPQQGGGRSPSLFSNAMNTMRQWSCKVVAARTGNVDQNPLVLYRPTAPEPIKRKP